MDGVPAGASFSQLSRGPFGEDEAGLTHVYLLTYSDDRELSLGLQAFR